MGNHKEKSYRRIHTLAFVFIISFENKFNVWKSTHGCCVISVPARDDLCHLLIKMKFANSLYPDNAN